MRDRSASPLEQLEPSAFPAKESALAASLCPIQPHVWQRAQLVAVERDGAEKVPRRQQIAPPQRHRDAERDGPAFGLHAVEREAVVEDGIAGRLRWMQVTKIDRPALEYYLGLALLRGSRIGIQRHLGVHVAWLNVLRGHQIHVHEEHGRRDVLNPDVEVHAAKRLRDVLRHTLCEICMQTAGTCKHVAGTVGSHLRWTLMLHAVNTHMSVLGVAVNAEPVQMRAVARRWNSIEPHWSQNDGTSALSGTKWWGNPPSSGTCFHRLDDNACCGARGSPR